MNKEEFNNKFWQYNIKIVLRTKFKVISIIKTKSKAFKNLKVGDIIEITMPLDYRKDSSKGQRMHIYINGEQTYISTLNKMIQEGFEFEEIKVQ